MKYKFATLVLGLCLVCVQCAKAPMEPLPIRDSDGLETQPTVEDITHVTALVVYSQDADDDYPFPSQELRDRIYARVSTYFEVMSYGRHRLTFKEVTDDGSYFRSEYSAAAYVKKFQEGVFDGVDYDGPYALYNREILELVQKKLGREIFEDVDLIISVATDGGPGWYIRTVNAQGFARLGFDFTVAGRTFSSDYGGITVEIGSDFTSELFREIELYWIFAHEYAHHLGYRRHRRLNIGIYSLMTPGLSSNEQMLARNLGPNPLDPFLIMAYGWLDRHDSTRVIVIDESQHDVRVTLRQIRSRQGPVLVQIPLPGTKTNGVYTESFFVAYHLNDGNPYDATYAGRGLLIWHVVNDRILDVECGEGLPNIPNTDHLDINVKMGGLPGDFFNSENGLEFTPATNPNTNVWGLYNPELKNEPSGIAITDIREDGEAVTFRVSFGQQG